MVTGTNPVFTGKTMAHASVRGVTLHYAVLGGAGPWVAIAPGGRRGIEGVQSLAQRLADAGYRVLVHDRRNCGASDVSIDGTGSEYEIWADDLHALLSQLGAVRAFVGGSSSGCRMAILYALRYPAAVDGLLLWRVTGGGAAARRLARNYYGQYIDAARHGGMAAVCATEHFAARIGERAENRALLLAMDPQRFIAVMENWNRYFVDGADLPIIGATEQQLRSIQTPACVVPGNDNSHPRHVGENLATLLPHAELHSLDLADYDLDLSPRDEWNVREPALAAIFTDFMARVEAGATTAAFQSPS
jgi:pimeloyl-ACP methyl ester carboxylesterase